MPTLGLTTEIVDQKTYASSISRFREAGITLPTFAQLADPLSIPGSTVEALASVDPETPNPLNLFRCHWHNSGSSPGFVEVPEHLVLPESLTGVPARIVILLGNRFGLIRAHKVLATYGCLVPRLLTGQFDPAAHKAVWPSTGNYCRGGVAVSRILGCRSVAVLPEGMSEERFRWLERWVTSPEDIIRTPGSESNVKEIYDKCAELDEDPHNIIFNQFSEFGNCLAHWLCTGQAMERVVEFLDQGPDGLAPFAFVSASGSGGTLGAGDYLKERFGTGIVAVEAVECPTLLYNGFGAHNIQGIGDKHVPLIHNVLNTDVAVGISDRATDALNVLFNSDTGRSYLTERRGVPAELVSELGNLGLSSLCNILACIKTAKHFGLGPDDALLTVATDDAELYHTERSKTLAESFPGGFDDVSAGEVFGESILGCGADHLQDLTWRDRERIFNLGYFTWVEQQGVSLEEFTARKDPAFWHGLRDLLPQWDAMIEKANGDSGMGPAG